MKKYFLGLLLIAVLLPTYSMAGTCGAAYLATDGKRVDDSRFLYTSMQAYSEAYKGADGDCKAGCPLKNGSVYVCSTDFCGGNKLFLTTNKTTYKAKYTGENHLFKCNPDVWSDQGVLKQCTSLDFGKVKTANNVEIGLYDGTYCLFTDKMIACKEGMKKDSRVNWNGTGCNCGDNAKWNGKKCVGSNDPCNSTYPEVKNDDKIVKVACSKVSPKSMKDFGEECYGKCYDNSKVYLGVKKCKKGYKVSTKSVLGDGYYTECVKDDGNSIGNGGGGGGRHNQKPKPQPTPTPKTCVDQCAGNPTCMLCCPLTEANAADWNGTQCVCRNGKLFEIKDGVAACVDAPVQKSCEDECGTNAECKACCALVKNNVAVWIGEKCVCNDSKTFVIKNGVGMCDNTAAEIDKLVSDLGTVESSFQVSKWKNAEGNFNTARLASDSVAGVVLGTAGGLITSKVIKKKQVANGMEDIECSIGGQRVSSYGDEFTVGR